LVKGKLVKLKGHAGYMIKRKRAKTLAQLKERAWKILSELIRREAADKDGYVSCYTCGKVHKWNSGLTGMHAGHAIPGRGGSVLLDWELIRPQCHYCNAKPPYGRGGEYHVFASKLIKENGMDWWEAKLSSSTQVKKWTRSDLQELIDTYKKRLEALDTQ
jgi:hypothetical protein